MAQFTGLVITKRGQALLAGVLAGITDKVRFTKVRLSGAEYDLSALEQLTELSDVRQTSPVSHIEKSSESAVNVEAEFSNETLSEGYYVRALGLYAEDGEGGELLYAVASEQSGNCYMPPFNGTTISGALVNVIAAVGNAENVVLEANSAAVATVNDIKRMEAALAEHNVSLDAHSGFQKELMALTGDVNLLKLKYNTNITANPFTVTFETADGIALDGVYNTERGTIDF